jgi:hypothetical protein
LADFAAIPISKKPCAGCRLIAKNANQGQGGNGKPRVRKTMRFSCLLLRIKAKRHIGAIEIGIAGQRATGGLRFI